MSKTAKLGSIVLISCDPIIADLSAIWNCSQNGEAMDYAAANPIERGMLWAKVSETGAQPKFLDIASELLHGVMNCRIKIKLVTFIRPKPVKLPP